MLPHQDQPPLRGLLSGRRVVITAGPTLEALDPIRVITNRSSGRMGFELAAACVAAGASVRLIAGPVALRTPMGAERVDVETAADMHLAVMAAIADCSGRDLFWAVAAVADWRPQTVASEKIQKGAGPGLGQLVWEENPDILSAVGHLPVKARPYVVGFAAETGDLSQIGPKLETKFKRKGADLLVGNIGPDVAGQAAAEMVVFDGQTTTPMPHASKSEQACSLVLQVARRLRDREGSCP